MSDDLIYPGATYRGPTPNRGGHDAESRGLVVHIADGSYEGTIAWQRNPVSDVSSEFIVAKSGAMAQMMPAEDTAWTQRVGNGHWDSVECEGHSGEALTPQQIEAIARLYVWGHTVRGWPLQVVTSPSGRGLGHHSMGAESGVDWGHSSCPGERIKAQKPAIIARAVQLLAGPTTITEEDDDMPPQYVQVQEDESLWVTYGPIRQEVISGIPFKARDAALGRPWDGDKPKGLIRLPRDQFFAVAPMVLNKDGVLEGGPSSTPGDGDAIATAVADKLAERLQS